MAELTEQVAMDVDQNGGVTASEGVENMEHKMETDSSAQPLAENRPSELYDPAEVDQVELNDQNNEETDSKPEQKELGADVKPEVPEIAPEPEEEPKKRTLQEIVASLGPKLQQKIQERDEEERKKAIPFVASEYKDEHGGTPLLEQTGSVVVGPGAEKEAQLLGLGLPKLNFRQHDDLAKAKKYAMEQSIKQVLMKQTISHQANQQKVAMYAQALSLMARVYIGSVSFEMREESVRSTFGPFGPIKSVSMSWDPVTGHHKGFAFLEYDVPEAALLAQEQMNGVLMGGRNIKVGRPSNMPQAQPIIEMIMEEAKEYHRIYVASIHPDLSEADVKSVFEAFGNVIGIQLAKNSVDSTGHRGYGYIEYDNIKSVGDAVASMNLFDLGGQYLRVGKAITPPQAQAFVVPTAVMNMPTAAAVAAAAVTAQIQAMEAKAGSNPIAAAGMADAPTVVVGAQATEIQTGFTSGAVYSVPAPQLITPVSLPAAAAANPAVVAAMSNLTPTSTIFSRQPDFITQANSTPSRESPGGGSPAVKAALSPAVKAALSPAVKAEGSPAPEGAEDIKPNDLNRDGSPAVQIAPPQVVEVKGLASFASPGSLKVPMALAAWGMAQPAGKSTTEGATTTSGAKASTKKPVVTRPKPKPKQPKESADSFGESNPMAVALYDEGDTPVEKVLKKKKKPKKKKGPKDSDTIKEFKQPGTIDVGAQEMLAAGTTQKLLESGALSEKQKAMIQNEVGSSLASQENLEIKGNEARNILMHKLMRKTESCVLLLKNMVGPEDVDEYLEEEIQEECSKYGQVDDVIIYQERAGGTDSDVTTVKIFIKFSLPQEAETGRNSLNNRFFNGNVIKANIYDQNLFDHNDLTG